jgi:hypothetical protein
MWAHLRADQRGPPEGGHYTISDRVRLKADTISARVRLKADTISARVRLKADATTILDRFWLTRQVLRFAITAETALKMRPAPVVPGFSLAPARPFQRGQSLKGGLQADLVGSG